MAARVILAFANDEDNSLKFLEQENTTVYSYLLRMGNGIVDPVQYKAISLKELFDEFVAKRNDIKVFHFSGHAGQMQLLFTQNKLASGEGIAKLMGYAANLKLVFLNGCGTSDLIDAFHKAGVNIVIASLRKVFDEEAAIFSIAFYASLSQLSSVGDAFDYAKSYLLANKNENLKNGEASRHISTSKLNEAQDTAFPYSIFYRPIEKSEQKIESNLKEYEKYEKWKFAYQDFKEVKYNPCIELLKCFGVKGYTLAKYLNDNNPNATTEIIEFGKLNNLYMTFVGGENNISRAMPLAEKIMDLLPRPLNDIMRRMIANSKAIDNGNIYVYNELLSNQLDFYDVLLKFSCYIMLSDLFETIYKIKTIPDRQPYLDEETSNQIQKLLSINKDEVDNFNYRNLIRKIRQKIFDNEQKPFVGEYMSDNFNVHIDDVDMAHEIIKIKKFQYFNNGLEDNLANHCNIIEHELCNILEEVFFILRYNLLVVRNIEAIKIRFEEDKTFKHKILLLRENQAEIKPEWDTINDYTENYSVILVKGLNTIMDYLSLSPFVIDKCILTNDDRSELFYYSHFDGDVLVYRGATENTDQISIELVSNKIKNFETGQMEEIVTIPYLKKLIEEKRIDPTKFSLARATIQLKKIYKQFKILKKIINDLSFTI